jgi:Tfp pilus assembly protein PilF
MMRKQKPSVAAQTAIFALALGLAGCASQPKSNEKSQATEPQKKAVVEAYAVALTSGSGFTCAIDKSGAPTDERELLGRAGACASRKDWNTLEAVSSALAERNPEQPWGVYFLSVAAEERGDHARAMWLIDQAIKKTTPQGLFHYQRARIWFSLNETHKAISEFERAVATDPRLTEAELFMADIYLRDLDTEKAAKYYDSVLAKDATNSRALAGLAEARTVSGETKAQANALDNKGGAR